MIYAASLGLPVKKALGDKGFQTLLPKIIELLPLDPKVSGMDAVILGSRDASITERAKLQRAVDTAHPSICIIYLYTKDNEKEILNCKYSKQLKKINPATVESVFNEFLSDHVVKEGNQNLYSQDDGISPMEKIAATVEAPREVVIEREEPNFADFKFEAEDMAIINNEPEEDITEDIKETITTEDRIKAIKDFKDWTLLKEQMKADSVMRKLIEENTEYSGLISMLEVLDQQIKSVFIDKTLTAEKKFEKIKEIGTNRTIFKSRCNMISADRVMNIIEAVSMSASRTVEEYLESTKKSLATLVISKDQLFDDSDIPELMNRKANLQLELMELIKEIIELYKSMDLLVTDSIKDLTDKLPSDNRFINEMVAPVDLSIFTPTNTGELATKLMSALQTNRVTMSQLEDNVKSIIDMIFKLFETDNEIIAYQQNLINILKANKVEDIVLRDSLLKGVLRAYVGADDTGRSATAITHSGVLSRRANTLVIDLTGKDKFEVYGIVPYRLEEFLTTKIERQLTCVAGTINDPEDLSEFIHQLKLKLNYYSYINLILPEDCVTVINSIASDLLSITYITDCTNRSLNYVKSLLKETNIDNVGKKLVMIDPPVSPLDIMNNIEADPTVTKVITLPTMQTIRACAIKNDNPWMYSDVSTIFDEAFN